MLLKAFTREYAKTIDTVTNSGYSKNLKQSKPDTFRLIFTKAPQTKVQQVVKT